ncbi:MAG: hypothetical protein ABJN40_13240 [Sneathiella sp.]
MTEKLFDIELDTHKHTRWLSSIAREQLPFAVARTLTMTAKDAQGTLKDEMSEKMTIRTGWVKAGLKITPARKKDGLHRMTSIVGHIDWYMAQQMGKQSKVRSARKNDYQFIPRAIRRTKTGKISKANRPGRILRKKNVFFQKRSKGYGAIVQKRRNRLVTLYSATKKQTIKPKMDLHQTSGQMATRRMNKNFVVAMRGAMRSAR